MKGIILPCDLNNKLNCPPCLVGIKSQVRRVRRGRSTTLNCSCRQDLQNPYEVGINYIFLVT